MESKGASNNERLLAAARSDNDDLLLEVFEQGDFDINCKDGLGNTPLHNAVSHGSTDVLEHILSHENCDVDPINLIEKATPLHLAVRIEHTALRRHIVESLLDAGADTRIKDKNGETVLDIIPHEDIETRTLIRRAQAEASVSHDDIASDDEDEAGSDSGSEED
ncbi:hypothetical protein Hypma_013426 [Hypsizygus marmoreus]|uniref:Uncharacterized protein n=1 Tax=Hypsizygus marmoreus TaxID=39966 RepID=A0A369JDG1_HYPMA|nr:hypothetical protein Hypma_013426 [Hypsizygus marmoreus]